MLAGIGLQPDVWAATNLFGCDFEGQLAPEWKTVDGTWRLNGECLEQSDSGPADPKKLLFVKGGPAALSTNVVVTAKVRIDSWPAQSDSRLGITVCSDLETGRGYNLVLHQGKLQFMRDYVAWGEGVPFPYEVGKWYWLKLRKEAEELEGKAWLDGEPEPAWMVAWNEDEDEPLGYPGLNGGSLGGPARLSFAEFRIDRIGGPGGSGLSRRVNQSLDGAWQVRPQSKASAGLSGLRDVLSATEGWIPAQVPGEIHLDLMKAGKMPDPSVGLNMPQCRWLETNSWWFRTRFEVAPDYLACERQLLLFDGLDLYAQVFLNGSLVGEAADAFVPVAFDVKGTARAGPNELVVRLTDGGERFPSSAGGSPATFQWGGRIWLRKPQFAWGWDWVDGLPNIGIWRGVRLEGRSRCVLDDLRLDTVRRGDPLCLQLEAVVENLNPTRVRTCSLVLQIEPPGGGAPIVRRYAGAAPPGKAPVRDLLQIPHPKLWWPNGLGAQPLYRVVARVTDAAGAVVYDQREFSIGLRTLELDRRPLAQGTRFCFRVNGQGVFCRGGNLGPQDAILARVSDAKYETLVAEAKNAHFTMFRLNGVAEVEGPAFYEACDRAGILLWHDFKFACSAYPDHDPRFMDAARAEIETAVRLYRHHPSLALWSANNECYGASPRLFRQLIPDLCRQLDPRRPCWPGSPAGGRLAGDTHDWYCAFPTPQSIPAEFGVRFITEYGILGPCHPDSVREYLGGDPIVRGDANWRFHTQEWERTSDAIGKGIRLNYADPEALSASEWSTYGQMWQAIIQGGMMEALRFQKLDPKHDVEGALIWSYTDCVGETGWAILDYYMRRKAAYYWFRRAAAPIKVLVRPRGEQLITRVVNDTLEPLKGTVEVGWWRLDGQGKDVKTHRVALNADGMLELAKEPMPSRGPHDPTEWLYAAVLRGKDGRLLDQAVWLGVPCRRLKLAPPRLETIRHPDGSIEVSSAAFAHAVHAEDHGRELISDNWFNLLPHVPVTLRVAKPGAAEPIDFEAVLPK
jgi:beta-mannosidase